MASHARGCVFPLTLARLAEVAGGSQAQGQCWDDGRVYATVAGRQDRLYRVADVILNGPLPAGLEVCHTCDNRRCWNPDHTFRGTHTDNMRDCAAKGRLGGSVTWDRETRLAAGLDWHHGREARWGR